MQMYYIQSVAPACRFAIVAVGYGKSIYGYGYGLAMGTVELVLYSQVSRPGITFMLSPVVA